MRARLLGHISRRRGAIDDVRLSDKKIFAACLLDPSENSDPSVMFSVQLQTPRVCSPADSLFLGRA
jgi:hypothetical protein